MGKEKEKEKKHSSSTPKNTSSKRCLSILIEWGFSSQPFSRPNHPKMTINKYCYTKNTFFFFFGLFDSNATIRRNVFPRAIRRIITLRLERDS